MRYSPVLFGALCGYICPMAFAVDNADVLSDPASAQKSMRMHIKQSETNFDKYSNFVDSSTSFTPKPSLYQLAQEYLLGKSESALMFEMRLEEMERIRKWKQERASRKRLGAAEANVQLTTQSGTMWHGEIFMGTGSVPMDIIYDTGSDWLVMEGKDCTNCDDNTYDPASSENSEKIATVTSQRFYGSASLTGFEYKDKVCLASEEYCIDSFEYFLITEQVGLAEPFDGILGMARNKPYLLGGDSTLEKPGPLFVEGLLAAETISENTFSVFLTPKGGQSYIDFGTPQASGMKASDDTRDIYVENDFFWSAYSQGMAFTDTSMENSYGYDKGSMVYSIIDTGSSGILLSSDYFDKIVKQIYKQIDSAKYTIKDGVVYSECISDSVMPSIFFMFNELWVEIKSEDYLVDVSPEQDSSICSLLIYKNPQPFHVFGTPFLQGYYTIHDATNAKIGFAPNTLSNKSKLQSGTLPVQFLDAPLQQQTSIWIYVITSIVTIGLACLYYWVLVPELNKCINSKMLVILIATISIASLAALFTYVILPAIRKAFGQQTEIALVDESSIPHDASVQATQEQSISMITFIFAFITCAYLLTSFIGATTASSPKKEPKKSNESLGNDIKQRKTKQLIKLLTAAVQQQQEAQSSQIYASNQLL